MNFSPVVFVSDESIDYKEELNVAEELSYVGVNREEVSIKSVLLFYLTHMLSTSFRNSML